MSSEPETTDIKRPNITVQDDPANSRYEVQVDETPAGAAYYEIRDDEVVFTHTEVDPKCGGKGVGSVLAKGALDDVRATDRRAIPLCPFIAAYIRRHREYLDIVDEKSVHLFEATPNT